MSRCFAVTAIILLSLIGAMQSHAQEAPKSPVITDPVYTKPQHLVDVDHGRRLNIYCRGSGSPTIIFDAGLGESTSTWGLVQPILAKKTRTCSYDRAGLGFSDPATRSGTTVNIADDLHRLLQAAHIAPPYILVGHSSAGMNVRVFADRYPKEVVGLVLIDPSHEDQSQREWKIGNANWNGYAEWETSLKEGQLCVDQAMHGLVKGTEAYKKCVPNPDLYMSAAINDAATHVWSTASWQSAALSEKENIFYKSADETRATRRDFGDMPIVVMTHAPYPKANDETQEIRDERTLVWEQMHNEVAAMSTRGVNEIVPKTGHFIQLDRPQAVIDAIEQVMSMTTDPSHMATDTTHD
jgi:pimeloyl-ACP methyl ester carboxylesterase